jgi:hypothetical protein
MRPKLHLTRFDRNPYIFKIVRAIGIFQSRRNPVFAMLPIIQALILVIDSEAEGTAGENAVAAEALKLPLVLLVAHIA